MLVISATSLDPSFRWDDEVLRIYTILRHMLRGNDKMNTFSIDTIHICKQSYRPNSFMQFSITASRTSSSVTDFNSATAFKAMIRFAGSLR